MTSSWDSLTAPNGDYALKCTDYIPAGHGSGSQYSDTAVFEFADPKVNEKYIPFRVYMLDTRGKPDSLTDDVWESIQERNARLEAEIFSAFDVEPGTSLQGKTTGKKTLRVGSSDRSGTTVNAIFLPNNPAPQGDYILEITSIQHREKEEVLGLREWHNLGFKIITDEPNDYSQVRGFDGMLKVRWTKDFIKRDEATGKGFEDAKGYIGTVQRDGETTDRILAAFGLPVSDRQEDDTTLFLEIPQLPELGMRTTNPIRLGQRIDARTEDTLNRIYWPPVRR